MKAKKKKGKAKKPTQKITEVEVNYVTCPECGTEQGDMGHQVECDTCGYFPMPTED